MKKSFIISVICLLLAVVSFTGCSNFWGSKSSNKYSPATNSPSTSAYHVCSDGMKAEYWFKIEYRSGFGIGSRLGLHKYNEPEFGIVTPIWKDDHWKITAKGSISGYTDEYMSDYEYIKFNLTVDCSVDGDFYNLKVEKVD